MDRHIVLFLSVLVVCTPVFAYFGSSPFGSDKFGTSEFSTGPFGEESETIAEVSGANFIFVDDNNFVFVDGNNFVFN